MIRRFAILSAISLVLLIDGCGNSGGGASQTPVPGGAQGFYSGTTSSGLAFTAIVLPNDKFFAVYGTPNGPALQVSGAIGGQGTSLSTTYTANLIDSSNMGGNIVTFIGGTLTATYVAGTSISGTIDENGTETTFTGTAVSNADLNWDTAASNNNVQGGTWVGNLVEGQITSLTITGSTFSGGSNNSGCMFTGTILPDSSGKNFFDVAITFGAVACDLPNQTAHGVAVLYLLPDGVTRRLLAVGTAPGIGADAFAGQFE